MCVCTLTLRVHFRRIYHIYIHAYINNYNYFDTVLWFGRLIISMFRTVCVCDLCHLTILH